MKKSRKEDVINSANCMIRKVGFSNLSFSQISKDIGVTRENVHHYFKKKEDLGNACLSSMALDLEEKFKEIHSLEIDAKEKLEEYFKIYKINQDDREDCPTVQLLNEYDLLPTSMQSQVKVLCDIEIENIEKILEEGIKDKIFIENIQVKDKSKEILTLLKGSVSYTKVFNNFKEISNNIINNLIN